MRKGQSLGIVYPQMKILSSFTLPNVIPNFQSTKEDILKNVITHFHWMDKKKAFLKMSLCSTEEKNHTIWDNMSVSKWWQHFLGELSL